MRRTLQVIATAVLPALMATAAALAQDPAAASNRRTISVTGQGEVDATPDQAIVSFAIETTAPKAGDAVTENAKRADAVVKALQGQVGKDDRVATTRYSVEPRYEPGRRGEGEQPRIIGYVARNEVQVETKAVNAVGTLIDTAIGAGANRVGNLQFTLANKAEQQRAALQKAAADARGQAESVAGGLGVKLRQIVAATTASAPIVPVRRYDYGMMAAEARAPTPIEPGTVTVSASLMVTWEIE